MPRISNERAITLLQSLKAMRCSVCTRDKNRRYPFCRSCYFALPESTQVVLRSVFSVRWTPDEEFLENFQRAKDFLFQMGHGRTA